jgi:hypothetical protein
MAWLWKSWDEYVRRVQPVAFDKPGYVRLAERDSLFEVDGRLRDAKRELDEGTQSLRKLGFAGRKHDKPPNDPAILGQAQRLVWEAVYAAEELLLYHRRLAESDASYGFLHQHDILKCWGRYSKTGRIFLEVQQLVQDIDCLLEGYEELVQVDEKFVTGDIDLPESLEVEFRTARNLFSIGLDEIGLLIAGRGMEGVLREIALKRKIVLQMGNRTSPAHEADFFDLIEIMFHLRWKKSGTRLISPDTKNLLHYLRAIRNSGAHASRAPKRMSSPREMAVVIARNATELWNEASGTRAQLVPTTVQKSW